MKSIIGNKVLYLGNNYHKLLWKSPFIFDKQCSETFVQKNWEHWKNIYHRKSFWKTFLIMKYAEIYLLPNMIQVDFSFLANKKLEAMNIDGLAFSLMNLGFWTFWTYLTSSTWNFDRDNLYLDSQYLPLLRWNQGAHINMKQREILTSSLSD